MFGLFSGASLPWRTLVKHLEKPIASLCLTVGLAACVYPSSLAQGFEFASNDTPTTSVQFLLTQVANSQPLANGTYLYGQTPERDQLGAAYMVFEVNQGQVVGAFYMPRSSFDCFYGTVEANQLALTIVDSYEQTIHSYSVALEPTDSVATLGSEATPVGLEGFHSIDGLTENDQRILSTCQTDFQQRI
ncbi:MAG: hypothetical protein HC769_12585 [Cyanobacteria bacterium CRU_2_1]|nr:hypothetical protein [Cyanobacteria bacterium RU_5_0]NJR59602.1 hypothetical protein [Cyanobacteria bacterium CRU_2_1]